MDWKKNDVFQTTIEDMSDSGEGIGKQMVLPGLLKILSLEIGWKPRQ